MILPKNDLWHRHKTKVYFASRDLILLGLRRKDFRAAIASWVNYQIPALKVCRRPNLCYVSSFHKRVVTLIMHQCSTINSTGLCPHRYELKKLSFALQDQPCYPIQLTWLRVQSLIKAVQSGSVCDMYGSQLAVACHTGTPVQGFRWLLF